MCLIPNGVFSLHAITPFFFVVLPKETAQIFKPNGPFMAIRR